MISLKIALFSFICTIVFAVVATITNVLPITVLALVSIMVCVGSLFAWLCGKIIEHFKNSLNIILIVIFFVLAAICYLLQETPIVVETLSDLASLSYISIAWVASAFACSISILVLIARLIFKRKGAKANEPH